VWSEWLRRPGGDPSELGLDQQIPRVGIAASQRNPDLELGKVAATVE
jgi:hypothetical protein